MIEHELESSRTTQQTQDVKRIAVLEKWFRFEYPARLNKIQRYSYLGLKLPESRYALEMEAYDKENELRRLRGLEELPSPKLQDLF